ncbi:hypothetical protein BDY17DRAFT_326608 [Neohortaea acidophila]|uniref:F-box domain-containing protein n=1 Tax=Neohortaea acidophila TaxID=245834 RepID=A0A6A6PL25_9PEZI|nr:uncharacterized protein BDY17DRAFT_326608 [Neohortaea acidophila]KAF2480729.1 hypothetical protein BDY17DRAFT_326608 [Neohortaea acidophila]
MALDTLPAELLECIAEWIPPDLPALLDLRITCSKICRSTHKVFVSRYFTDRTFMLADPASMETLLCISQRSDLRRSMHTLRFSFATMREAEDWVAGALYHLDETALNPVDATQLKELHWNGGMHKRLVKAEARFRRSADDVRVLHKVLTNFHRSGHIPTIVAGGRDFCTDDYQRRASGYMHRLRRFAKPVQHYEAALIGVDHHDPTRFHMLYQAIRETEYPVQQLQLGSEVFGLPLCVFEPFSRTGGVSTFSRLKALRLAIAPTNRAVAVRQWLGPRIQPALRHFIAFLAEAANLELLALSRSECNLELDGSESIFRALARAIMDGRVSSLPQAAQSTPILQQLQHFELEGFAFEWRDLVKIVKARRATLRRLTVENVQVRHGSVEGRVPRPADAVLSLQEAFGDGVLDLVGDIFCEKVEKDGLFD